MFLYASKKIEPRCLHSSEVPEKFSALLFSTCMIGVIDLTSATAVNFSNRKPLAFKMLHPFGDSAILRAFLRSGLIRTVPFLVTGISS